MGCDAVGSLAGSTDVLPTGAALIAQLRLCCHTSSRRDGEAAQAEGGVQQKRSEDAISGKEWWTWEKNMLDSDSAS